MSLITDEERRAKLLSTYQQAAALKTVTAESEAMTRARQAQSDAIQKAIQEESIKAAYQQSADLRTGEQVLREGKVNTEYEIKSAVTYTKYKINEATKQNSQIVSQYNDYSSNKDKYTSESWKVYEDSYRKYLDDYKKFIGGSRNNLDILRTATLQKPLRTYKLTSEQREAYFTAGTTFSINYTENGLEMTKTFKNLGDAQEFVKLQNIKSAKYSIRYIEDGKDKIATFKTAARADHFIEQLTGTTSTLKQQALESTYELKKRKGMFDLSDVIKTAINAGAIMSEKAILAKQEGRDIEAGFLTATGSLYRFGWGLALYPLGVYQTVETLATKGAGPIISAARADPVVTAMNLAMLGYSAYRIGDALNTKFGITDKAYAAKLGNDAFEIITKEDKLFYYPPETQMPGYEMLDFESYIPKHRMSIVDWAAGTWELDMSDWNKIQFENLYKVLDTPDIYVNPETWTPNLVRTGSPTTLSLQFDAKGNPYLDFGPMLNKQVNSVAAMREFYDIQLGLARLSGSGMTETILNISQVEGGTRPVYALINYTPEGVTITSEIGVMFIPVTSIRQKYENTDIVGLNDSQIIAATPILMNVIADPKIRQEELLKLDNMTIGIVLNALDTKSLQVAITGLSSDTVSSLITRLDEAQVQELINKLTVTQIQDIVQNQTQEQIQEIVPILASTLDISKIEEIIKILPPEKKKIFLKALRDMEFKRVSMPVSKSMFFIVTLMYGKTKRVRYIRARSFPVALSLVMVNPNPISVDMVRIR